jgi:hypothetical protein
MRASFETVRLSLSLVRETDRGNLVALERDRGVMRFLNGGRPATEDVDAGASFLMPRGGEDDVWAADEIVRAPSWDGSRSGVWARASANLA